MKTKAVRIYGKKDLRMEEFELPGMQEDEILAHVISDSICMSSHKAALQGAEHKRVPDDIHINPTMIGHEFAGVIIEVGKKWQHKFKKGQKFSISAGHEPYGNAQCAGLLLSLYRRRCYLYYYSIDCYGSRQSPGL